MSTTHEVASRLDRLADRYHNAGHLLSADQARAAARAARSASGVAEAEAIAEQLAEGRFLWRRTVMLAAGESGDGDGGDRGGGEGGGGGGEGGGGEGGGGEGGDGDGGGGDGGAGDGGAGDGGAGDGGTGDGSSSAGGEAAVGPPPGYHYDYLDAGTIRLEVQNGFHIEIVGGFPTEVENTPAPSDPPEQPAAPQPPASPQPPAPPQPPVPEQPAETTPPSPANRPVPPEPRSDQPHSAPAPAPPVSGPTPGPGGASPGAGAGGFRVDDAIAQLDGHATKASRHVCALAIRQALEAGGLDTSGHPVDAKDYGPFLQSHGFVRVGPANGYQPARGDIIVLQPVAGLTSPSGHIAMFDGTRWVSDFFQRDQWGGPGYRKRAAYEIFRRR